MSQGVIVALLVLAGLLVLRLTNLPPFSGSSTTQSPTSQTSPTPITRSTGFSTGVATEASESTTIPNTTPTPSPSAGSSGSATSTGTNPKPSPIRGSW